MQLQVVGDQIQFGESVLDYFSRTMLIGNKILVHGDQMQNVTIMEKILHSLRAKFDYIVCSIKESKDIDVLSIDGLQSSLLLHERKVNQNSNNTKEKALKASTCVESI